ncbi:MAG: FAD-dependent oxidoreductase [Planctomycetota bacterium]
MPECVDIVGGGVTGLTAAWALLERGVRVRLHEARPAEAGLAASFRREGFAFDFGPHEFCTDDPALVRLLEEICGDDLLVVTKRVAQYFRGRFLTYPFQPVDVLRNLPTGLALRAVAEAGGKQIARLVSSGPDDSFESWTRARFGPTLWREYFGPYTEKVWGIPPGELDADVARNRISVDSAWSLLRKTLAFRLGRKEDRRETHSEFRHDFHYVRGGIGELSAALRRGIEARGAEIFFGRRLAGIECRPGGVRALDFADGTRVADVETLVSTIPLPDLATLALGDEGRTLVAQHPLPFRGMVFVFLRLARERWSDFHWVYVPEATLPFQRITEFVHFEAGMCPPGTTGLTLEIAAFPGDATWNASDEAIRARAIAGLRAIAPLADEEILGADVVQVSGAYPLQIRGHAEHAARALEALAPLENLVTIGRQGLFRYCNMNECMEMALDVAPRIADGERNVRTRAKASWKGVSVAEDASPSGSR